MEKRTAGAIRAAEQIAGKNELLRPFEIAHYADIIDKETGASDMFKVLKDADLLFSKLLHGGHFGFEDIPNKCGEILEQMKATIARAEGAHK